MKKAIVLVSFGTTFKETREKNLDRIRKDLEESFPDFEVFEAYTSNIVRKRIKENEGIEYPRVDEILPGLKEEGFEEIYLQPSHVIPGIEYRKALGQMEEHLCDNVLIKMGTPLLYDLEDYLAVAGAFKTKFKDLGEDEAVLFMSHGTESPSFTSYVAVDYFFQGSNIYSACVEGYPGLDLALPQLKKGSYRKIHLYPFMIVAGDHAHNDMAGDSEDSWAKILEKEGYETEEHLVGLGEEKLIRDIFVEKTRKLIS